MWKTLLLAISIIILCHADIAQAQAAGIKKNPGDPIIWNWSYLVADEPNATGFRLYISNSQTGPFTFTGSSFMPSSVRTGTTPASFSSGSVVSWYIIRAYYNGTNPPATVESGDSNAWEVDRAVPLPTGLQGK